MSNAAIEILLARLLTDQSELERFLRDREGYLVGLLLSENARRDLIALDANILRTAGNGFIKKKRREQRPSKHGPL